jgi:hypothetical protein
VVKLEERSLDLRGLPVPERRGHRLFAPNARTWIMNAVWQRERADGIWIWNARWGLGVCAYHLQAERSGAKARGKVASEGAGGVGAL